MFRISVLTLALAAVVGLFEIGATGPIPDNSEYQQQRCVDNCG